MKIWFIRHETDYGPFFSTKERAIELLKEDAEWWAKYGEEVLADKSPYTTIQEVELDDKDVCFDG